MNKVNLNVLVWSIIFGFALYGASVFNTVPAVAQNTPPELFPYVYPHGIDDDMSGESSGNNNGIIEAGETIELTLTLSNWGEENATGVYAWVDLISRLDDPAVSDPYVTLLRGGQNTPLHFPDMPAPYVEDGIAQEKIAFQVLQDKPYLEPVVFNLIIESDQGQQTQSFALETNIIPLVTSSHTIPLLPFFDDLDGEYDLFRLMSIRKLEVYENKIVWPQTYIRTGSSGAYYSVDNVYMCFINGDLSITEVIPVATDPSIGAYDPVIFEDKIVWVRHERPDLHCGDIYMSYMDENNHTLSEPIQITGLDANTSNSDESNPAIYGNKIVWQDERRSTPGTHVSDIYLYDLERGEELLVATDTNGMSCCDPLIYGDKIVWTKKEGGTYSGDNRDKNWDVYMCNIIETAEGITFSNEIPVANSPIRTESVQAIHGNKIVFASCDNSYEDNHSYYSVNKDLYVYDLLTGEQRLVISDCDTLYDSDDNARPIAIYGNQIAWEANNDIFVCEVDENLLLGEIKQITTNIFPQCRPALNENNLFWVDGRIAISDIFQEIYTATLTDETTLPNHPPVAVVGQDQTVDTGERVRFDASGSHDEDGEIVSYTWDFGDDSFATGVTASHTYDSAGEYTVTLTVEDNDGATAIATCIITVEFALFEKVIPAYRANIKSKWFTSGTTLWTYWSDTWVEYNVDIPFSGYYYIGIYAKNTGNLPAPEGYKFRIEVDVDGRDTGKIIEVPYVANSTRYIPRSKKIYLNRGRRKIKYKWLNDYHDPGRYDANIQIQKIYVNASPKKVRIPVNYTSYKSSGWKFISSSRTLYVSSRYSKAVEYVMPVPVTGYHYVGFRAKATKDCRVYVYVDGLRQEGTISLPANDDYRYRSKRLKLNKGSRKIKFRFTKYAPKTIYLNEVYIKQCSKQSQVATAAAVKSRWYTRYPTLYTYWSVSWAEYNFDIPRDGYYYVGISVRNKDGRLLPYGYMFDIEVHDVHIRERMNDGIYDYTWSRKGKISIRANGDNYLSGFIRTYLPKGEHKIKYMWLNDYHIPGRYDANIQIKEVFVKEVQ